jgi:bifunctional DNA-binding transcriptional regulator/antitoxin component of YhaV-PrlF toxin-antitoxin module
MPEVRMRPKSQITLPASIVRAANLQTDDRLTVSLVNGNIVISPQRNQAEVSGGGVMAFAGAGRGIWGQTADEVAATARSLRAEWER